jgi:hypothetical protein
MWMNTHTSGERGVDPLDALTLAAKELLHGPGLSRPKAMACGEKGAVEDGEVQGLAFGHIRQ